MPVPCRYRTAVVPLLSAAIGDIAVIYDLLFRASADLEPSFPSQRRTLQ
jgi:hypothetical protein